MIFVVLRVHGAPCIVWPWIVRLQLNQSKGDLKLCDNIEECSFIYVSLCDVSALFVPFLM